MYSNLISNRDKLLKSIDDIITENSDTFIKSIKFTTKKFYNDIIQNYLDCIRKQVGKEGRRLFPILFMYITPFP